MNNKKISDSINNQLGTSSPKSIVKPAKHPVINHRYQTYRVQELEIEETRIFEIERETHTLPLLSLIRKAAKK